MIVSLCFLLFFFQVLCLSSGFLFCGNHKTLALLKMSLMYNSPFSSDSLTCIHSVLPSSFSDFVLQVISLYVVHYRSLVIFLKACILFFLFKILFIFREREREGEREGEKQQCVVASRVPPTGSLACNTGMCPD